MIKIFEYENSPIQFEVVDGHVMANATLMAKAFKKKPDDIFKTKAWIQFEEAVIEDLKVQFEDIRSVKNGGNVRGSWIHQELVIEFARRLAPKFALWCNRKIAELLRTGTVSLQEHQHAISQLYISQVKASWQKTFIDQFYRQIYRLNGWPFTEESLRFKPGYVGKITNEYVYNMLPPGVSELLRKVSNKSGKLHQFLTPEIGREHLKFQITFVTGIMSAAHSWRHFQDLFMASNGQTSLDFGKLGVAKIKAI